MPSKFNIIFLKIHFSFDTGKAKNTSIPLGNLNALLMTLKPYNGGKNVFKNWNFNN
jgi:hypothetical protein